MSFIRAANPIWFFVDHVGLPLNDTYYAFFMSNDLPYLPQVVYQDPLGTIPWSDPIELQPSGTLPDNLYFDSTKIYRIEIRQGNTQFGQLIWLIENFVPGNGGGTPSNFSINTENVITNPQFAEINFVSPLISTAATIDIAPGWVINATGSSGSITITQLAFSGSQNVVTNPPFALEIVSTGWTNVTLQQTFAGNGALWTNEAVALAFTARGSSTDNTINGTIVYSDTTQSLVISQPLTGAYTAYSQAVTIPASANPNISPNASTALEISWTSPSTVDITSIQLIGQDMPAALNYEQLPIERQEDNLFHYYKNALIAKPKASILSGWNFSLNPMQFYPKALTTAVNQTQYIADQTIIHQLAGSTVQTGRTGIRECLQVKALTGTTNNRFALIQYIDQSTILPYWSYLLSSLARMRIFTTHGTSVGVKMRLIWRTTLPTTIGATEPIASWAGTDPIFAAGWTAIAPLNDPTYILPNSYDSTESGQAFPAFPYDAFKMPDWNVSNADTYYLGIVVYTTANMNSSSGTEDSIEFDRISLVPNDFAVDSPPQTADEVLRECQYYYESNDGYTCLQNSIVVQGAPNNAAVASAAAFRINYQTIKRAIPAITVFSSSAPFAANTVFVALNYETIGSAYGTQNATVGLTGMGGFWVGPSATTSLAVWLPISFVNLATAVALGGSTYSASDIAFTFTLDSRLGV